MYAPNAATTIATTRPAIGPAIAISNNMSRFTVRPLDWMNAPNVGIPKTGTPGTVSYTHLTLPTSDLV